VLNCFRDTPASFPDKKLTSSLIKYSTSSYIFNSDGSSKIVNLCAKQRATKASKAVVECGCDAKIVERRGGVF
jgi:hypothetical protein